MFCVQVAPPRRQQPDLGDFIAAAKPKHRKNGNRYQPLTLEETSSVGEIITRKMAIVRL